MRWEGEDEEGEVVEQSEIPESRREGSSGRGFSEGRRDVQEKVGPRWRVERGNGRGRGR